jgi:2-polyprenyl-3-methyl-5-hydroxy-6-metoxy-1,4-benzoquinol methylase
MRADVASTALQPARLPDGQQVYLERLYENEGLPALVDLVDRNHRRILDVGCGNGSNMALLAARGHAPVGLTLSESEAEICRRRGFECLVADVDAGALAFSDMGFDGLLLSHVLEHLPWPAQTLRRLVTLLAPGGGVYVALPNVLFIKNRLEFLRGRFRYTETGLMDRTHLRFFDFESARALLEDAGLRVTTHFGLGPVPSGPLRRMAPSLARQLDRWGARRWPGLFAFHMLIVGRRDDG